MPASVIRLILESAFNQGDLSAVEELLAPDSITHIPAWGLPHSRTGLKQLIASLRLAFPDLRCALEDEIGEGERCAAHWTVRGTHTGLFLGNPATGKPIVAQGIIFARTADGRIVEGWLLIDQFGILQQLGIVPPPRGLGRRWTSTRRLRRGKNGRECTTDSKPPATTSSSTSRVQAA